MDVIDAVMFRYEMQANGMDEDRKKQEQEKINTELLKKLQDLDTDILFSTGGYLYLSERLLEKETKHCFNHFCCSFLCFCLFHFSGPEFVTEQGCIFVGMVTDDVDVSDLVDTIAALGRDIEESGKVSPAFSLQNI